VRTVLFVNEFTEFSYSCYKGIRYWRVLVPNVNDSSHHAHRFFHLGVHVPFYLHFWGYIQIFGGAMYPSNSSFEGTMKINCIFSTQGRAPCCFCKYYAELAKTFFFCLTLDQTGSGVLSDPWPLCLSHHFFVILYITCQILFVIQNWMQDFLYIVMIIKQLN
jgi:hypothetical protein